MIEVPSEISGLARESRNRPGLEQDAEERMHGFEDLAWLFNCDNRNCGIIRQTFSEAALLWKAVKATNGAILEIGRSFAGSTALLAAASGGRTVFSLDVKSTEHARTLEFLERNGNKGRIHRLLSDSRKPLNQSYGLLFIDGDHSFEGVLADVLAHWNGLHVEERRPALAAFHDALPNDNFAWCKKSTRWRRFRKGLKNVFCQKRPEIVRGYKPAVNRVCQALIDHGVAEPWRSAGSMWVLRKITDLPTNFDRHARAARGEAR